eukprot:scaffold501926_cov14-Prasinocladus_malaysianus.AAC.1
MQSHEVVASDVPSKCQNRRCNHVIQQDSGDISSSSYSIVHRCGYVLGAEETDERLSVGSHRFPTLGELLPPGCSHEKLRCVWRTYLGLCVDASP